MRSSFRPFLCGVLAALLVSRAALAQRGKDEGTLVIAASREATTPIPTLFANDAANREVSDLLFLRLADLGPTLNTVDERSFVPRLARSWRRPDARTLIFELDPRARWHDGQPVTSQDVVFTFERARNATLSVQVSGLVRHITSVTAEGSSRVVFRFDQPYPEQFYDATYHNPPLPAHLLATLPPESLATSAFAAAPVGNGPYRWVRRVPNQLIELAANDAFFEGRPKIRRVVFLIASDPETRLNLLLSGQADAVDNLYQFSSPDRLAQSPEFRPMPVRTFTIGFLLLNQRDPADTSRPHPLLQDVIVRRALTLALDRATLTRSVFWDSAAVPGGPVSRAQWLFPHAPPPPPFDTAQARRLLAGRGWLDHDGDGILDKDGRPLALGLTVPITSAVRQRLALQAQEQYRRFGVRLDVEVLEPSLYSGRRQGGRFDIDFSSTIQDPTPSGLVQSWSCAGIGGSNVAHYCDPALDSLIARASATGRGAEAVWNKALARIREDAPAIFVYAPQFVYMVHRRYEHVSIRPESSWADVWRWSVRPGEQLARDQ